MEVVKASIIGSIIGNVLLVLGASFLVGGLKNGTQKYSVTIAGANAGMLAIVAALALPTIFVATEAQRGGGSPTTLSIEVAVVMLVVYVLYLLFYFRHPEGTAADEEQDEPVPSFGPRASLALLLAATAAVAYVSRRRSWAP